MVNFIPVEHGDFRVEYDNGVHMGDISRAHDFNYNFWPELKHGGFWPGHVLKAIVEKLEELNKPLDEELNEWFEKNPPSPNDEIFGG
jgi:hypothetical protein